MQKRSQVAIAVLATLSASAWAQTATEPAKRSALSLPTINVEGQGERLNPRESDNPQVTAPLVDTPKSITILPQVLLQEINATTLADSLRLSSGITFGAAEGGNPVGDRPFIRGYDAAASLFVDGVRDAGSQTRDTFAIEQVEITKGPSSAFAGRGSAGGSINLISKLPQPVSFGQGSIGIGTDQYARALADGNFAFSSGDAAMRVVAMGATTDIPGRDYVYDDRWGVMPSVTFGLKGPTQATFSYYHLNDRSMPDYSTPYDPTTGRPVEVDRGNFYGLDNRDFRRSAVDIGTAQIKHALTPDITIQNTTRYGRSTNDYIATNPDDSAGNVVNGQVWRSVKSRNSATTTATNQTDLFGEFKLGGLQNNFLAGLEFSREETYNNAYLVANGNRNCALEPPSSFNCTSLYDPTPADPWAGTITNAPNSTTTRTDTTSVYGFDTLELSPQWLLNLGLRYDDYRTRSDTPAYTSAAGAAVAAVNLRNDSDFWNYQVGVVFKPAQNGSIYVSYGTSSQPPGTSNGDGADNISVTTQSLEPVTTRSWELGTKWEFLNRALTLTSAIFYTDTDNARAQVDASTFANVGEQKIKGFEVGVAGAVTRDWSVFANYTFLDSELVSNGPFGANPEYDGNQFPNTPRNSASLWTTYQLLPQLVVGGGAFYVDKQYGNTANTRWIPSYWRFDAMAAYTIDKTFSVQLNVQNLANEKYWDQAYTTHYAHQAPGRQAILSLNARF